MPSNEILDKLLTKEAFDPWPERAHRPEILVRFGVLFASTSVLTVLSVPPDARLIFGTAYVFYFSLAMLFLFGIGLMVLGWYAADYPENHNAATRIAIRASQLALVVAALLYKIVNS